MPRVSVLIAAYNSGEFLRQTLESVFAQTYDDWEVVLADDASTDDTVAIACSFGERVRVVRRTANSGRPSITRASALERAEGELIAFLDADDWWLPQYLERMTATFDRAHARNPRVAVAACDAQILLPDGQIARRTYADEAGTTEDLTLNRMLRGNPVYTSAVVRRAVIEDAGGLATELTGTDDYDLWLRILELGHEIVATREALAVYRLRATSLSADTSSMALNIAAVYERAIARGRLDARQRRTAERQLRLQLALARYEHIAALRRGGAFPVGETLQSLPLFARVGCERAGEIPRAMRQLLGDRRPFAATLSEDTTRSS